jgi:Ca2+:H+ antiporter
MIASENRVVAAVARTRGTRRPGPDGARRLNPRQLAAGAGLAFTAGGLRHGAQRFGTESVRTIATLLVLAVPALAIPALATTPGAPDAGHPRDLSIVWAVVLLVVFACSIPLSIRGGRGATALTARTGKISPMPLAVGMLAAAAIAAAFVSDRFVEARWGPPVAI